MWSSATCCRPRPMPPISPATSASGPGFPIETPAVTVNRLCGSGSRPWCRAPQQILLGESRVVLAGGAESMSQAPHVVRGARWGIRLGASPPLEDPLWAALRDTHCDLSMAETAENLAREYGIERAAVDCFAALSQARARDAWAPGATTPPKSFRSGGRPEDARHPSRGPPTSTCAPTPRPRSSPRCRRLPEGRGGHRRQRLRHQRRRGRAGPGR